MRWRLDLRHTGYELPGCTAPLELLALVPIKQFHVPVTGPVLYVESSICVATGSPEPMDYMQTSPGEMGGQCWQYMGVSLSPSTPCRCDGIRGPCIRST